ncbi:hypothetical protein, partial [Cronobacter sakazakii]|uniref:hypothetical protein n=1 Tax=Cronobacter sakazakii TaxID=28141 RepID=UPI001F461616
RRIYDYCIDRVHAYTISFQQPAFQKGFTRQAQLGLQSLANPKGAQAGLRTAFGRFLLRLVSHHIRSVKATQCRLLIYSTNFKSSRLLVVCPQKLSGYCYASQAYSRRKTILNYSVWRRIYDYCIDRVHAYTISFQQPAFQKGFTRQAQL